MQTHTEARPEGEAIWLQYLNLLVEEAEHVLLDCMFVVLDFLLRPYGEFYDFSDERSLAGLRKICVGEGRPLPGAQDI